MKNRSVFFHCLKHGSKCSLLRRVIGILFIEIPKVTVTEINLWQTSCRRLFLSVRSYPCFPMLCNDLHEKKLYYIALIIVFTW